MPLLSITLRPSLTSFPDIPTTTTTQWPLHSTNCKSYQFGIQIVCSFASSGQLLQHALHYDDSHHVPTTFVLKKARADVPLQLVKERLIVRCLSDGSGLHEGLQNGDVITMLNGVEEPSFGMLYGRMARREILHVTVWRDREENVDRVEATKQPPVQATLENHSMDVVCKDTTAWSPCSSSSTNSSSSSSDSSSSDSSSSSSSVDNPTPQPTTQTRKRTASLLTTVSIPTNSRIAPSNPPSNEMNRLWPDPSDAIKALTRWIPPTAVLQSNPGKDPDVQFVGPIRAKDETVKCVNPMLQSLQVSRNEGSHSFKDAEQFVRTFAYPLLIEGLCSLNAEYHAEKRKGGVWDRPTYSLRVTKLSEVFPIFQAKSYFTEPITMYEIQFALNGSSQLPPKGLSELYAIHFHDWKSSKFGIVAHDFPTSVSFMRTRRDNTATLKLWICVVEDERLAENTGWITRREFRLLLDPYRTNHPLQVKRDGISMTLISVGSTINVVRQFEAIKSLSHLKPHLQKTILTSPLTSKHSQTTEPNPKRPPSVPLDIWQNLKRTNNSYQLQSISDLLSGSCRENVSLIQGPPGTGKSSTIVGLVSALLSGKASLPGAKRSTSYIIHPGKTMGTSMKETHVQNRILVCATTNQAVDTLAWKIKNQSLGTSGKVGDFKMARFGSLPWDSARDTLGDKPKVLSEMEQFLQDINVDMKASSASNFDDSDDEWGDCWTSPRKQKKRKRFRGGAQRRSEILSSANIVLTTLSGAGSKSFIQAVSRNQNKTNSEFRAVIIDEACQSSEPESLIPFKFNPTTVTLVGDPQQLPVLTFSSTRYKVYQRSLFERLQNLDWHTILLREQYRMHEVIATFPSQQFYKGQLVTSNNVKSRPVQAWSNNPCFNQPLAFWDSAGSTLTKRGNGFANMGEVDFIVRVLLTSFAKEYLVRSDNTITVGIISFYKEQVKLLQKGVAAVPALRNNARLNVKVNTVDGFQGSECDIIILSCVRSHADEVSKQNGKKGPGVGFIKDYKRANVALTRAKQHLWIVGNSEVLKTSELWRKLVRQLEQRKVANAMGNFKCMYSNWKSRQE